MDETDTVWAGILMPSNICSAHKPSVPLVEQGPSCWGGGSLGKDSVSAVGASCVSQGIATETSPGNLHMHVCSHSQPATYTGLNICRFGRDGMSLVFRTSQPKQDAVQNKTQHN